ncbi:hypothetical protein [Corynebacterium frankenforstense]|uniref:hypothetical protein n=1 Tax=Corynebacterium frankenforstense TaxID=1230998 RepID=UPI0026EB9A77|nr:hypothetical protein [Corynebacterium frankenforstense]
MNLKPGYLDGLARDIDAKSDRDLATFLGITTQQLEQLRYGAPITPMAASILEARRQAHLKAAELFDGQSAGDVDKQTA